MYPPELTEPMRRELAAAGVAELRTPQDVDRFMSEKKGTALLVINSICGCAAGSARPAIRMALAKDPRPERAVSVFAGVDTEATARARGYFSDVPPSSPSMYLFRDGELVWVLPRHMIEARPPQEIAEDLADAFRQHCAAPAKK
jgi:putative YphP/YqiW family bacilliredoxin